MASSSDEGDYRGRVVGVAFLESLLIFLSLYLPKGL